MALFTAFAVYFIIGWVTLFVVLPFGVQSQAESGTVIPGTDPGAPVNPRLPLKLAINTVLAGIIFGVWYFVTYELGYGLDNLPAYF